MFKKIAFLLLLVGFAGFQPAKASEVVFINPGFNDKGFWSNVSGTMQAAAKDLGISLEVIASDRNRSKLLSNVKAVMSREKKPKYLLAVNEEQYGEIAVELVRGTDTKLLFLLNDLTAEQKLKSGSARSDNPNWIGSITPNAKFGGFEMGLSIIQAAKEKFGEPVEIFAVAGDKVTPSSIARNDGLEQAVAENPSSRIVRFLAAKWDQDTAKKLTERFIASGAGNSVRAYWGGNDGISIGMMTALEKAGLKGGEDYFIAGLNWSQPALKLVKDGQMTLTHGGHFFAGAYSIVMIHDYENGTDFADENVDINFPMSAIDESNVSMYLDNLGSGDWDAIDFKKLSKVSNRSLKDYSFTLSSLLDAL